MAHKLMLAHVHHILSAGAVTKAELLHCVAQKYERTDIRITTNEAQTSVDRTLATADPALSRELWRVAGYSEPPSTAQMIAELAQFDYRFRIEQYTQQSY
jgi:hypothetical protein